MNSVRLVVEVKGGSFISRRLETLVADFAQSDTFQIGSLQAEEKMEAINSMGITNVLDGLEQDDKMQNREREREREKESTGRPNKTA